MRIGIFMYGLTWGGATRRIITLAKGFEERGHHVRLLVVEKEGHLSSTVSGMDTVELNKGILKTIQKRFSKKRRIDLSRWALAQYLREAEKDRGLDILLSAANHAHIAAISARLLSGTHIPLVIRISNHLTCSLKGQRGFRKRIRFLKACRLYPQADGFIAVSRQIAQDAAKATGIPKDKINVVYNPVFTPELLQEACQEPNHPWLRLRGAKGPKILLGAGRLVGQKDFATLVRAFKFAQDKTDLRLIILGEGKERPFLEKLISRLQLQDKVDLHGFVPNPVSFMARADLFCLSSRFEGLPGVIIEAMATGCPIVSTDSPGGAREILEDGRYGILVPTGDEQALAKAILKALDIDWDGEELKRRAESFSVDKAVKGYISLFEKVLAEKSQGRAKT